MEPRQMKCEHCGKESASSEKREPSTAQEWYEQFGPGKQAAPSAILPNDSTSIPSQRLASSEARPGTTTDEPANGETHRRLVAPRSGSGEGVSQADGGERPAPSCSTPDKNGAEIAARLPDPRQDAKPPTQVRLSWIVSMMWDLGMYTQAREVQRLGDAFYTVSSAIAPHGKLDDLSQTRDPANPMIARLDAAMGASQPSGWEPFDDYMPPGACVLLKPEDLKKPLVLCDKNGNWWIRNPVSAPSDGGGA